MEILTMKIDIYSSIGAISYSKMLGKRRYIFSLAVAEGNVGL
jgi:hypothetical protein